MTGWSFKAPQVIFHVSHHGEWAVTQWFDNPQQFFFPDCRVRPKGQPKSILENTTSLVHADFLVGRSNRFFRFPLSNWSAFLHFTNFENPPAFFIFQPNKFHVAQNIPRSKQRPKGRLLSCFRFSGVPAADSEPSEPFLLPPQLCDQSKWKSKVT